ncbi:hypothetical protein ABZP36_026527 [Zizania latifolia]
MATPAAARHHHHGELSRSGERRRRRGAVRCSSPAQEFAALAAVFRRRLVVGASTAAAAAVGANFGGVTSFLLGLSPELGRLLRLDVLYPVGGFTRCLDSENGFDVGEVVLRRIARTKRGPDINATLIDAALREDAENKVKYYKLEFRVESPSFRRRNVAVCCAKDGKLYTLNAQAPESAWKAVQKDFLAVADSFSLVVDV